MAVSLSLPLLKCRPAKAFEVPHGDGTGGVEILAGLVGVCDEIHQV